MPIEIGARYFQHNLPPLHDIKAVGQICGKSEILLDEQNRKPFFLQRSHGSPEGLDNHGSQTFRDFIE